MCIYREREHYKVYKSFWDIQKYLFNALSPHLLTQWSPDTPMLVGAKFGQPYLEDCNPYFACDKSNHAHMRGYGKLLQFAYIVHDIFARTHQFHQ